MNKLNPDKLGTEEIYYLLKKRAKSEQQKSCPDFPNSLRLSNNEDNFKLYILKSKKCISLKNNTNWKNTNFSANYNSHEILYPVIPTNKWEPFTFNSISSFNIVNKIFKSDEKINYGILNNKISGEILLKGLSQFWIFLHVNEEFDDKTIVIIFSKDEYKNIAKVSLGTFLSFDKRLNFYILQTQQLIENFSDKSKNKNNFDLDDDSYCKINFLIEDEGNNIIKINTKVNDGEIYNELTGDYFKRVDNEPIMRNYKNLSNENLSIFNKSNINGIEPNNYGIMIAGSGQECIIKEFCSLANPKDYIINLFKQSQENCLCCNIY